MVGLIQVGDNPPPLAQAEIDKLPRRAADRLTELIAEVDGSDTEGSSAQ